ncbi:MAG: hypothetical protein HC880_07400 [Bacteroidia bacterium]|nr:hypothetical protein [Bacteroidia bacterium]
MTDTWLVYGFMILVLLLFEFRKFKYLVCAFLCLLLLSTNRMLREYGQQRQQWLVLYAGLKVPHVHFIEGQENVFLADSLFATHFESYQRRIGNFLLSRGLNSPVFGEDVSSANSRAPLFAYRDNGAYALLVWQRKSFFILKQNIPYREFARFSRLQTDYLIVQNNALRSLKKINDYFKPQLLVVDGSNSFYQARRLSREAQQLGIPCHSVPEQGAFLLKP